MAKIWTPKTKGLGFPFRGSTRGCVFGPRDFSRHGKIKFRTPSGSGRIPGAKKGRFLEGYPPEQDFFSAPLRRPRSLAVHKTGARNGRHHRGRTYRAVRAWMRFQRFASVGFGFSGRDRRPLGARDFRSPRHYCPSGGVIFGDPEGALANRPAKPFGKGLLLTQKRRFGVRCVSRPTPTFSRARLACPKNDHQKLATPPGPHARKGPIFGQNLDPGDEGSWFPISGVDQRVRFRASRFLSPRQN